jgi:hypothetical protein
VQRISNPLIYNVICPQQLVFLGAILNPSADFLRTLATASAQAGMVGDCYWRRGLMMVMPLPGW